MSFHLIFGRSIFLFPGISNISNVFTVFITSHNILGYVHLVVPQMCSFLVLSLCVPPHIHSSIIIPYTSILVFCHFVVAGISAEWLAWPDQFAFAIDYMALCSLEGYCDNLSYPQVTGCYSLGHLYLTLGKEGSGHLYYFFSPFATVSLCEVASLAETFPSFPVSRPFHPDVPGFQVPSDSVCPSQLRSSSRALQSTFPQLL